MASRGIKLVKLLFGLYVLAWTSLAHGRAVDVPETGIASSYSPSPSSAAAGGTDLMPPLIFPTDKQRNNIKPINKTAIKILMHEDDLYSSNSSSSLMTKEGDNKDASSKSGSANDGIKFTSGEADDLRKTDQEIATSEEGHAKYAKSHPDEVPKKVGTERLNAQSGFKDEVENIQEVNSKITDLEEQYNRPSYMSVSIVNMSTDDSVQKHFAWVPVSIVVVLAMMIFAILLLWRRKLEQRYGNRHQLFTNEEDLRDIYV